MIHMDLVEVPNFIPGDWVVRCKTDKMAPQIQVGDWLILTEQDTAEPGQLVIVDAGDGAVSLEVFAAGMKVRGRVTGLMRRLA